jgi:rRNA maturation protein Nop10
MMKASGSHKVDRYTLTLVPTSDERGLRNVPSTFSPADRTYGWKHFDQIEYMLVPRRIANDEVKVDIFVELPKRTKVDLQKTIQAFVAAKIRSDWHGLRLGSIARASEAEPPSETFKRATIEEILGARLAS